jgi:DNA-directed RNA polymerase subunit F
MDTKEFYSEEPVTIAEVKKLLTAISKDKEELEYVQKKALEHAQHAAKVSYTDATKMVNEMTEAGISKEKAIEVINAMPANLDELRAFFAKERKPVETAELEKLLEIMAKYR